MMKPFFIFVFLLSCFMVACKDPVSDSDQEKPGKQGPEVLTPDEKPGDFTPPVDDPDPDQKVEDVKSVAQTSGKKPQGVAVSPSGEESVVVAAEMASPPAVVVALKPESVPAVAPPEKESPPVSSSDGGVVAEGSSSLALNPATAGATNVSQQTPASDAKEGEDSLSVGGLASVSDLPSAVGDNMEVVSKSSSSGEELPKLKALRDGEGVSVQVRSSGKVPELKAVDGGPVPVSGTREFFGSEKPSLKGLCEKEKRVLLRQMFYDFIESPARSREDLREEALKRAEVSLVQPPPLKRGKLNAPEKAWYDQGVLFDNKHKTYTSECNSYVKPIAYADFRLSLREKKFEYDLVHLRLHAEVNYDREKDIYHGPSETTHHYFVAHADGAGELKHIFRYRNKDEWLKDENNYQVRCDALLPGAFIPPFRFYDFSKFWDDFLFSETLEEWRIQGYKTQAAFWDSLVPDFISGFFTGEAAGGGSSSSPSLKAEFRAWWNRTKEVDCYAWGYDFRKCQLWSLKELCRQYKLMGEPRRCPLNLEYPQCGRSAFFEPDACDEDF